MKKNSTIKLNYVSLTQHYFVWVKDNFIGTVAQIFFFSTLYIHLDFCLSTKPKSVLTKIYVAVFSREYSAHMHRYTNSFLTIGYGSQFYIVLMKITVSHW